MSVGASSLSGTPRAAPEPPAAVPVEGPRADPPQRLVPRLDIKPAPVADVLRLERELGLSHPVAQVLVRRGLGDPDAARRWLAADTEHHHSEFQGMGDAVALILRHAEAGSRITVHGDYDVDGVCSTAVLVRALGRLGATVDFYLPSRLEDGYGLNALTVQRLADKGTNLLITADCAITAVDEVAAARAAGMDVVVTDHHSPRADGVLPDAPIVHPALSGYPCVDLCAGGVAYKVAQALMEAAGRDPREVDEDLDLVALATVADVVPLKGENRRLVRAGLKALAATRKPGLRALMRVAKVDPTRLDAGSIGFRLAPRINAAGRLYRADAGLELVLTEDPERAAAVADELDRCNAERRLTEQRILFAAEAQVREQGDQPAYVLAGEDWHPGVVGIVASRIAERYHRPAVLIALDEATGSGSGRSVPGFDLLAGLNASAEHLVKHGGHKAAAGLEVRREDLDAFRAAFVAHAEVHLTEELRTPVERVDAVVAGDELGLKLAEELETLAPFGMGNPSVRLLVPAARLTDPRPMGEGNKHLRLSVEAGGLRARAVSFGCDGKLPEGSEGPLDATFALELNEFQGAVEPRLVLRSARPCGDAPIDLVGVDDRAYLDAAFAELDAPLDQPARLAAAQPVRDRRGGGGAGVIAALVASGEPVLVVAADAPLRRAHLAGRLGGFALTDHAALERDPAIVARFAHVVLLDPPPREPAIVPGPTVHLAYGEAEISFALSIHEREHGLRAPLTAIYRDLRALGTVAGEELEAALRGQDPQRSPAVAGRALRVLAELGLVSLDRDRRTVTVPAAERTELDRSAAYRSYEARREDEERFLRSCTARTRPAEALAA
jgi:single-stranded-DNA-specific exonuclease